MPINYDSNINILTWFLCLATFSSCLLGVQMLLTGVSIRPADKLTKTPVVYINFRVIYGIVILTILACAALTHLMKFDTGSVRNLGDTLFNLFCSCLLPITVGWLYFVHAVKSCSTCRFRVPRESIRIRFKAKTLMLFLLSGCSTTWSVAVILGYQVLADPKITVILTVFAVLMSCLEIIHNKSAYGFIRLYSVVWVWYTGTWLGALVVHLM